MSRVSDQGLPRSVTAYAQLPANAYEGALCVVESGENSGAYVYVGGVWTAMASVSNEPSQVQAASYATVTAFPASPSAGQIVYAASTNAPYWYNGSAWKKIGEEKTSVIAPTYATTSAFPSSASAGQIVFCTADTSLYMYNGAAWKKITSAT